VGWFGARRRRSILGRLFCLGLIWGPTLVGVRMHSYRRGSGYSLQPAVETQCISAVETQCVHVVETQCVHVVETQCISAVETQCISAVETQCVHVVETQCISAVETQCVHVVETQCISAVETQCISAVETQCLASLRAGVRCYPSGRGLGKFCKFCCGFRLLCCCIKVAQYNLRKIKCAENIGEQCLKIKKAKLPPPWCLHNGKILIVNSFKMSVKVQTKFQL
jgi:hypothetical protein